VDSFFVRTLQPASNTSADAAEFQSAAVAPGQLVSIFGTGLAAGTTVASNQPWPSSLGGVSMKVVDSEGTDRNAGLVFASPGQVNAQLPQPLARGPASLTVIRDGATVQQDRVQVITTAPTLFVQPHDGLNRPLGQIVYEVPRSVAGRGEVTRSILVNGVPGTAVRLSIE
jgi:uncharacterized protein (TIGR03437 family)